MLATEMPIHSQCQRQFSTIRKIHLIILKYVYIYIYKILARWIRYMYVGFVFEYSLIVSDSTRNQNKRPTTFFSAYKRISSVCVFVCRIDAICFVCLSYRQHSLCPFDVCATLPLCCQRPNRAILCHPTTRLSNWMTILMDNEGATNATRHRQDSNWSYRIKCKQQKQYNCCYGEIK